MALKGCFETIKAARNNVCSVCLSFDRILNFLVFQATCKDYHLLVFATNFASFLSRFYFFISSFAVASADLDLDKSLDKKEVVVVLVEYLGHLTGRKYG